VKRQPAPKSENRGAYCDGEGFMGKNASSTLTLLPNWSGNKLTFRLWVCQTLRNDAVGVLQAVQVGFGKSVEAK
jgi:hypothetical protein